MIAAIAFYQLLATASFTLLGLWFVVVGLSHGGWRTDPNRHRYDLHVALHFLLPGATGLAAVLAGGEPLFWRAAALLAGIAGMAESIGFLVTPGFPRALPGRFLRALDPLLYGGVGVAAVTSLPLGKLVPMQVEGVATGLVFLTGTAYLWLAYAERPAPLPTATRALNRI
jgi:hypothetical protein